MRQPSCFTRSIFLLPPSAKAMASPMTLLPHLSNTSLSVGFAASFASQRTFSASHPFAPAIALSPKGKGPMSTASLKDLKPACTG